MNCKYEYYLGFEKKGTGQYMLTGGRWRSKNCTGPVLLHEEVNNEPLNNFKRSVDNHNDKLLILLDKYLDFLLVPFSSAEVLHLG